MTTYSKLLTIIVTFTILCFSGYSASMYDARGDFTVDVEKQKTTVFNDDINTKFSFVIENTRDSYQGFSVVANKQSGWDIDISDKSFTLDDGERKEIEVEYSANSDFDYSTLVVSADLVKISQNDDYIGYFEFPLTIYGKYENISLKFGVTINKKEILPVKFSPKLSTEEVSPVSPLKFTITGENLIEDETVDISVLFDGEEIMSFTDTISNKNSYKIYTKEIETGINPGLYETKLIVRLQSQEEKSATEWFDESTTTVDVYENVDVKESFEANLFSDNYQIKVYNLGNIMSSFDKEIEVGFIKSMFFNTENEYVKTDSGVMFSKELEKGEEYIINYSYNYFALYIIFVVLIVIVGYLYLRKTSNPLDIEVKIYEVKKVTHEGVKSMKVRIGFENIKADEIEDLKVIFRMPSYLKVKDESFLLAPPKHALKGRSQYKLIWEFKRFEKNDSRILGFQLINTKGILGDIKIPAVEFEVKINGKIRRYYEVFPSIRG